MKRRVVKFPSAARENTVTLDQFDDLLINPNAHPEPDVTDSGERPDVKDSGERPDVRDSGAGNLMSDVKDSRESAPSTTHDTQLTRTTR